MSDLKFRSILKFSYPINEYTSSMFPVIRTIRQTSKDSIKKTNDVCKVRIEEKSSMPNKKG